MEPAELLKSAMFAAFSLSWYFSLYQMLKTLKVTGKSILFILFVVFGYVCACLSGLFVFIERGEVGFSVYLAIVNLIVTFLDFLLVIHLSKSPKPLPILLKIHTIINKNQKKPTISKPGIHKTGKQSRRQARKLNHAKKMRRPNHPKREVA